MNYARVSALVLTVLISGGSFTVSFAALTDLAAHHGITPPLAQVWALIVDMTIVAATIARLVMPTSRYSAGMLITAAAVAVAGNMLHATEFGAVGVAIAVVPPAALLGQFTCASCCHSTARCQQSHQSRGSRASDQTGCRRRETPCQTWRIVGARARQTHNPTPRPRASTSSPQPEPRR